jgi:hypothetical protein
LVGSAAFEHAARDLNFLLFSLLKGLVNIACFGELLLGRVT